MIRMQHTLPLFEERGGGGEDQTIRGTFTRVPCVIRRSEQIFARSCLISDDIRLNKCLISLLLLKIQLKENSSLLMVFVLNKQFNLQ